MPEQSAPPRSPRAHERRRLEAAAASLFARRGYAKTTVDDIVGAAGLSKPALYRHFESKKQLHMALLEHHRDALAAAALDAGFAEGGAVDARLHSMLDAWFAYVEQHPYSGLLFRDTTGDPEVHALHLELQARQRAADIALLREFAPAIPERELEPLGETLRSSLYGLALLWLERPELQRETLVATMMRVVRGILLTAR
jgi:AcrR family transcriptional regulator